MRTSPFIITRVTTPAPRHDEIAHCARELWMESGRPAGRDEAIWLEAETRLIATRRAPAIPNLRLPSLSRHRFVRKPL